MVLNPETQKNLINKNKSASQEEAEPAVVSAPATPVVETSTPVTPVVADPPAEKVSVSTFVSSLNKTAITISSDLSPKPVESVKSSEPTIPVEKITPAAESVKPAEEEKPKVLFRSNGNTNGVNKVSGLRSSPSVAGDRKTRVKSGIQKLIMNLGVFNLTSKKIFKSTIKVNSSTLMVSQSIKLNKFQILET